MTGWRPRCSLPTAHGCWPPRWMAPRVSGKPAPAANCFGSNTMPGCGRPHFRGTALAWRLRQWIELREYGTPNTGRELVRVTFDDPARCIAFSPRRRVPRHRRRRQNPARLGSRGEPRDRARRIRQQRAKRAPFLRTAPRLSPVRPIIARVFSIPRRFGKLPACSTKGRSPPSRIPRTVRRSQPRRTMILRGFGMRTAGASCCACAMRITCAASRFRRMARSSPPHRTTAPRASGTQEPARNSRGCSTTIKLGRWLLSRRHAARDGVERRHRPNLGLEHAETRHRHARPADLPDLGNQSEVAEPSQRSRADPALAEVYSSAGQNMRDLCATLPP